jgi:hypothetical protein
MVKKANELAIRQSASLAATAWHKLEAAAQEAMAANGAAPALQLFSNGEGITAKIEDRHTMVLVQHGKISVQVKSETAE